MQMVGEPCQAILEDFCAVFILFNTVWFFPSDCCSNVLPKSKGSFSSVNYPSPYPNNSNCLWLIRIRRSKVIFIRRKKIWTTVSRLHSIISLLWLPSGSNFRGPRHLFCYAVNEKIVSTIFIRLIKAIRCII